MATLLVAPSDGKKASGDDTRGKDFTSAQDWPSWDEYFASNVSAAREREWHIDWGADVALSRREENRWVDSWRAFHTAVCVDGRRLPAVLDAKGYAYASGVSSLIAERRRHARLARMLLARFDADVLLRPGSSPLGGAGRRGLGRLGVLGVLCLWAVVTAVATVYYGWAQAGAPDPVIRAVAGCLLPEVSAHARFLESVLAESFAGVGAFRAGAWSFLWALSAVVAALAMGWRHAAVLAGKGGSRVQVAVQTWQAVDGARRSAMRQAARRRKFPF
ncbi:hypothetical protein SAMN05421595_2607 [Austwickia chelonae]|uniref:Uncharacterized protein n=1 Tax=Austwickia chelonae NBRC 105200 TaxID=1184607 RepID=K6VAM4_9MICO|nr:hypothetical protein [Austwickia chelonae]GAB79298.1 hypothetical protein AUCHE_22_00680 [Austwickia chelonae NBRC 105200]SEW38039.1 hypothetical protein SAMN05421595_2607 [Austwickia chelonae]